VTAPRHPPHLDAGVAVSGDLAEGLDEVLAHELEADRRSRERPPLSEAPGAADLQQVSVEAGDEPVRRQHALEGVVPGHLSRAIGDPALDARVHDDVQAGGVGELPEDVLQVAVLEIEVDRRTRTGAEPNGSPAT